MKTIRNMVGLIILLVMTSSFSKIDEKASMTHAKFDVLLKKHVSAAGNVNYEGFKKDVAALDSYLKELSASVPGASASRNERLAYYMNAYNAFTVKLILNNYPVTSIKNISAKPWDIKFIKLGDETHSLNTIEHNILRKMGDPRIHVGINCASVSCPKLLNKAFTAANVTAELTKLTKLFLKDTTKNKITTTSASISEIFSWFKTDFTKKGTMIDWINKYSEVKIKAGTKITYMKYNWNLNK